MKAAGPIGSTLTRYGCELGSGEVWSILYTTPLLRHATPLFLMPHPSSSCHTPLPHATPFFLMPLPQVIFPLEQNLQLLSMAVQAATRHGSGWSHSITEEDLIAAATDSDVIELMASRLLRRLGGEEGGAKEGEASS